MTDRNRYFDMYDKAHDYQRQLETVYANKGYTVYCSFVAVGNTDTNEYFVDLEIGGSPSKYRHIKTNMTEAKLLELINK